MKTILFVDDDEGVRMSFEEILRRFGYEVISCVDGSSALSMIHSGSRIDLAIIDMIMPGMNGLEVIEGIRRARPYLPCILLTGNATVETYVKAMNLGIYEYLNKPIRKKELGAVVTSAFAWGDEHTSRTKGITERA